MADEDDSRIRFYQEAISLALALSSDGLAVGLGAAISDVNYILVILTSLIVGFMSVILGGILGRRISMSKHQITGYF